jgi:hypothetical protein
VERVAFLLPDTGLWIRCLLNPESLTMQRRSGVRQPSNNGEQLVGRGVADDPIYVTGGGSTKLVLDLLFDITLSHQSVTDDDVRYLSDPIWRLADAAGDEAGTIVRLVWGKSWNIPGIILNASQRFDDFQRNGIPRRNWMRLDFRRVDEDEADRLSPARGGIAQVRPSVRDGTPHKAVAGDFVSGQRIDLLAAAHLGDAGQWRVLADANDIDDPFTIEPSHVLRLPESV